MPRESVSRVCCIRVWRAATRHNCTCCRFTSLDFTATATAAANPNHVAKKTGRVNMYLCVHDGSRDSVFVCGVEEKSTGPGAVRCTRDAPGVPTFDRRWS